MARVRAGLGLVAGVLLILSAAAHSLMGGKAMGAQMEAAHVPLDLSRGLLVGWHFGGVAMLAFGLIAVAVFAKRLRGESVSALPAVVIGLAYLGFGVLGAGHQLPESLLPDLHRARAHAPGWLLGKDLSMRAGLRLLASSVVLSTLLASELLSGSSRAGDTKGHRVSRSVSHQPRRRRDGQGREPRFGPLPWRLRGSAWEETRDDHELPGGEARHGRDRRSSTFRSPGYPSRE